MTYEEFVEELNDKLAGNLGDLRKGQMVMITLLDKWAAEYNRISLMEYEESNIDCFYSDSRIPNTLSHLEKNWHQYPN